MKSNRELWLESELAWIHALMTNSDMQSREKVVFYEAHYEMVRSKVDENGLSHISVSGIAKRVGMGRDAVGESLELLCEYGVIRRELGHYVKGEGRVNLIALTDLGRDPKSIKLSEKSKSWGGKREKGQRTFKCKHCGSEDVTLHKKIVCQNCQTVLSEKEIHLGERPLSLPPHLTESEVAMVYRAVTDDGVKFSMNGKGEIEVEVPSDWKQAEIDQLHSFVEQHRPILVRIFVDGSPLEEAF